MNRTNVRICLFKVFYSLPPFLRSQKMVLVLFFQALEMADISNKTNYSLQRTFNRNEGAKVKYSQTRL